MKKFTIALASAASLALVACGDTATEDTTMDDEATMADGTSVDENQPGTIVEVAQGNGDFSTLVSAVQTAELGETLSGEGPYTVFAPTNSAFEAVDPATMEQLMSEEGREQLTGILTYHVVEGETNAEALTQAITEAGEGGYTITTVNGAELTATVDGGNVILTDAAGNTATVVQTDVDASNGIIHAIDSVLMPQ
ncbi:fasciclin domain-containing protein [Aurantiacibacter aquimixticola]|uniref:Fasciclin domain-containing protein n=1 Tax=Aurantiacibacter aquimixticola TaxID=1958945 RepID=A0A419RVX3_9SPHN|nr:fasciclin domain-containing protein [Aurantiacibacter aquimixticola]RJY09950.1 fasciclin domain-containing protein [Aurantiacibacter aquimixticola]